MEEAKVRKLDFYKSTFKSSNQISRERRLREQTFIALAEKQTAFNAKLP